MVYGGALLKELNLFQDFTLFVVAGVLEEGFEGEADRFIFEKNELRSIPDFIVIGEPSSLSIARGNKGRVELKVTTKGKSAHASSPHLGENAIYKMAPIIKELEELNERLPANSVMGKGVLAVTSIEAKTSSRNAVPAECSIYIDRRLVPEDTCEQVLASIKSLPSMKDGILEVVTDRLTSYTGISYLKKKFFPSWLFEESHSLVQSAFKTYELLFANKPEIITWYFCTNANYTAGEAKVPTIGFGPGDAKLAHTADEYVKVEQVEKAVCFYAAFPKILCGK